MRATPTSRSIASSAGRAALLLAGGALVLASAACGDGAKATAQQSPAPGGGASTDSGNLGGIPTTAEPSGSGAPTAAPTTAGPGKSASANPHASGGAKTAPGPVIVTFRVKRQPTCPAGTVQVPIEGNPAVIEWEVTGVDEVVLAVDGPGAYGTYKAKDSETLSFPCSGPANSTQKHTYTIRAKHNGKEVSKTITASATVYERAST